ncbi:unnamed protein product [Heterobilharzia americana]|nr:unnamed protein product [Heterobilharzia americana]
MISIASFLLCGISSRISNLYFHSTTFCFSLTGFTLFLIVNRVLIILCTFLRMNNFDTNIRGKFCCICRSLLLLFISPLGS